LKLSRPSEMRAVSCGLASGSDEITSSVIAGILIERSHSPL